MAQVKFGSQQLNKPTPANYDRLVKIFIGVSGLLLAWFPTNNLVPHHVQDVLTPIINLLNSVLLFLLPFFGVQTDAKKIPADQVTQMENPPTQ